MPCASSQNRTRDLNDRFRHLRQGNGRVFVTTGIKARAPVFLTEVIYSARTFDTFSAQNDPHDEHDFDAVTVIAARVFWEIDSYDPTLASGSADPEDETKIYRVCTIMLAQEY